MLLDPNRYAEVSPDELLAAAERGYIGVDHRFLRALLDRFDEAVPSLVRFGLEEREGDGVALEEDLIALFRYRPTRAALPFLIECLRRQSLDVSENLLEAFCPLSEAAVEPLLDLHKEFGEEQGREVAFVLAALQVRDARILQLLLAGLDSDVEEAATCLGLYGDSDALPALRRKLHDLEAEQSSSEWEKRGLREAIESLEHPEPAAPPEPYDIWAEYAEEETPWFDILSERDRLEFLKSPVPEYRESAAASFGGELQPAVKSRLFEAAKYDPEARVRAACWEALQEAQEEDAVIREGMLARLADANAPLAERCGALVGLAGSGEAAVERWMLEFYNLPGARAKALEAMWHAGDRRFGEYMARHLEDPDHKIRRQAVLGAGYLGLHTQLAKLRKLFDDEGMRLEALFSYALASPGEVSRLRMRQLFNKIDEMAGGLSGVEAETVETAINQRLQAHGLEPLAITNSEEADDFR